MSIGDGRDKNLIAPRDTAPADLNHHALGLTESGMDQATAAGSSDPGIAQHGAANPRAKTCVRR
jgi:hypothetical protein